MSDMFMGSVLTLLYAVVHFVIARYTNVMFFRVRGITTLEDYILMSKCRKGCALDFMV